MKHILPALVLAAPALADEFDDRATAVFSAVYQDACDGAFLEDGSLIEPPRRFSTRSATTYADEPVPMEIWIFRCSIGAYNTQSVVVGHSDTYGMVPMTLAKPEIDIVLEDPEDPDSAVLEVRILGWSSTPFVVNPEFDPTRGELREVGYWRGLGDASSTAVWHLVNEEFRLVSYDVDPTYDGESNPSPLVRFD